MKLLLLLLASCASDSADPRADCNPAEPDVTWVTFGHGFTLARCDGCHAATSPDRQGAPDDVTFDSEDDARALAPRVRTVVLEKSTMPPAGGVSMDDMVLVDAWLSCDFGQ